MIRVGSLLFILTIVLYSNVPAQNDRAIAEMFSEGVELWEKLEYSKAIDQFDKVLYLKPSMAQAYLYRGRSKSQLGLHTEAIIDYTLCLELADQEKAVLLARAQSLLQTQQYRQAKEDLETLQTLPAAETSEVYFRQSSSGGGVTAMQTMAGGMQADILNYLGQAERGLGNIGKAIGYFDQLISQQPENADFYVNRGLCFDDLNQIEKATEDYKSALQFDPFNTAAQYNLTLLQESNNGADDLSVDKFITANPNEVEGYLKRAHKALKSKDYPLAISDLQKALSLDRDSPEAWMNLGIAFAGLKKWNRAMESYDEAIEIDPTRPEIYFNRGNAFYVMKEYEVALRNYNVALLYYPDYGVAYYQRGLTYYQLGNRVSACQDLKASLTRGISLAKAALNKVCKGYK